MSGVELESLLSADSTDGVSPFFLLLKTNAIGREIGSR